MRFFMRDKQKVQKYDVPSDSCKDAGMITMKLKKFSKLHH